MDLILCSDFPGFMHIEFIHIHDPGRNWYGVENWGIKDKDINTFGLARKFSENTGAPSVMLLPHPSMIGSK